MILTKGAPARKPDRADEKPAFVSINLIRRRHVLPARRREARLLLLGIMAPGLLFSLLALALVYSVNRGIITRAERMLAEQETRETEKIRALVAPAEEEQAWLAEMKRLLDEHKSRLPVAGKLVVLSELLPGGFYLESLDFKEQGLRLTGRAPAGNQAIAELAGLTAGLNRNEEFALGLGELKLISAEEKDEHLFFTLAAEPAAKPATPKQAAKPAASQPAKPATNEQ